MPKSKIKVYVRFGREPGKPQAGMVRQFAVASFDGETLTRQQEKTFIAKLVALQSCRAVEFLGKGADYRGMVRCLPYGDNGEEDFITEVEACLRKHYDVKRVTRPKGVKK